MSRECIFRNHRITVLQYLRVRVVAVASSSRRRRRRRRRVVVVASQKTPNTGQNRIVRVRASVAKQKTQTGTLAI